MGHINSRVRLWDLPGGGTIIFPQDKYIQTMGLRHFDVVIIVSSGRLTEAEHFIREELNKHKVPVFFVRQIIWVLVMDLIW
jgi:hypothetical protein